MKIFDHLRVYSIYNLLRSASAIIQIASVLLVWMRYGKLKKRKENYTFPIIIYHYGIINELRHFVDSNPSKHKRSIPVEKPLTATGNHYRLEMGRKMGMKVSKLFSKKERREGKNTRRYHEGQINSRMMIEIQGTIINHKTNI